MGSVHPHGEGLGPKITCPDLYFCPAFHPLFTEKHNFGVAGQLLVLDAPPRGGSVKHFDDAAWSDFVRKVVPSEAALEMQRHVDAGCQQCQAVVATWTGVYSVANKEAAYTPPADAVRIVTSQFIEFARQREKRQWARLVFDSSLQPLAAGLRGAVSARQFLYETDELYVDLRIEPHKEAARLFLVGQILNRGQGRHRAQEIPVQLLKGNLAIAGTATNQFGEFQLEFDPGQDLCLAIRPEETPEIVLPLYGIHEPETKPHDRGTTYNAN